MIVIGIDPSSTSTGYGLIEHRQRKCRFLDCGCIRPPAKLGFEDRLVFLYENLSDILAAKRPDEAAVESTFFGKDARAATKLGQARGVLLLDLRQIDLPIAHYSPAEVKKAIAGSGQATKEQVQYMIARMLELKELPQPLDASDALGIATCHVYHSGVKFNTNGGQRKPEVEALLKRMKR